jgi:hypothetical protein
MRRAMWPRNRPPPPPTLSASPQNLTKYVRQALYTSSTTASQATLSPKTHRRAPRPPSRDYTSPTSPHNLTNCLRRYLQPHKPHTRRAPLGEQGRQGSLQNLVKSAPQPLERWRTPFEALKLAIQSMNIERARRKARVTAKCGAKAALEPTGVISWMCTSQITSISTMAPVGGKLLSVFLREMTFEKIVARCTISVL